MPDPHEAILLCYGPEDAEDVRTLADSLRDGGVSYWPDPASEPTGNSFSEKLQDKAAAAALILVCLGSSKPPEETLATASAALYDEDEGGPVAFLDG